MGKITNQNSQKFNLFVYIEQKVKSSMYFEATVSSSSILTLSCLFSLDDSQFEMDI